MDYKNYNIGKTHVAKDDFSMWANIKVNGYLGFEDLLNDEFNTLHLSNTNNYYEIFLGTKVLCAVNTIDNLLDFIRQICFNDFEIYKVLWFNIYENKKECFSMKCYLKPKKL